jgi:hypothetical protein
MESEMDMEFYMKMEKFGIRDSIKMINGKKE